MKLAKKVRPRCSLNGGRWISYTVAAAATAVAATNDAEAGILYSGALNLSYSVPQAHGTLKLKTIISNGHLGGSVFASMKHYATDALNPVGFNSSQKASDRFKVLGSFFGKAKGFLSAGHPYASKLASGAVISGGAFNASGTVNRMASNGLHGKWKTAGTGFLGFEFNPGGGVEYGWARVTIGGGGTKAYSKMTLVDYAYGTPGQAITAGQTAVPEPASLGLLAVGAVGLFCIRGAKKGKTSSAM